MVATHIKKIKRRILCVTVVYLRDIIDTFFFFFNFALECELFERFLLSYVWHRSSIISSFFVHV